MGAIEQPIVDRGDWILTHTGKQFHILDPRPEDICIEDIAWSLAHQCRFTGHCGRFFSIARHSINVAALAPYEFRLEGLLHDASEAYLTDVAAPIKPYLSNYKTLEDKVMSAIASKYRINWPVAAEIKRLDEIAVCIEGLQLFNGPVWAVERLKPLRRNYPYLCANMGDLVDNIQKEDHSFHRDVEDFLRSFSQYV